MASKKEKPIPKTTKGKGRNYLSVKEGAGMSKIGMERWNKKNNANLKPPVPNPKTDAERARKKSFCARSAGWTGERGRAAKKRWGCN